MTIGFRSNKNNFVKTDNLFRIVNFFSYVCRTGKSKNFAEASILKDIFIFVANGHCFEKLLVSSGDIKFS